MIEKDFLVPLYCISSRQEAMERCIGPLAMLTVCSAIDTVKPEVQSQKESCGAEEHLGIVAASLVRLMQDQDPATLKLRGFNERIRLTADQKDVFKKFTFHGSNIDGLIDETLVAQGDILNSMILPAVLSAKDDITAIPKAHKHYQDQSCKVVAELLHSSDVSKITRSLSFSANGAFSGLEKSQSDDVFATAREAIARSATIHKVVINSELAEPIKVTQLCVKQPDGKITLSKRAVKTLRQFMKMDNAYTVHNSPESGWQRLNGSRGCPASMKSVQIHPDDLTPYQLDALTSGGNPIARYDTETNVLTLMRSPIDDFNHLLADAICPP